MITIKRRLFQSKKQLFAGLSLLLISFFLLASLYIQYKKVLYQKQLSMHATIIADDLFYNCTTGVSHYLSIIARQDKYHGFTVTQLNNSHDIYIKGPSLSGPDKLLADNHIIQLSKLDEAIVHNDTVIGQLHGERYFQLFYPLFGLFSFLFLLMIGALSMFNLLYHRKLLKHQIFERTKKFRESERRFEDLVNLLPEMVSESDLNGTIIYANARALKQFKRSEKEIGQTTIFDQMIPEDREKITAAFIDVIQGKPQQLQEFTAQATDGKTFPVLTRSAPIYTNGQVTGIRTVIIDITERHILEEKLQRAQKMEVVGLMAGGVAHDLNNILSGIVNYPELILMKLPEKSPLRDNVQAIKNSGLRAAEIVADMLTVSRGVAASKSVADPNALIQEYLHSPEYLQLQKISPGIIWEVLLGKDVGNILCSATHFRKSLMNLVTNAVEAINSKGQITITTSKFRPESQDISSKKFKKSNYCVVTIHDTGAGIPAKDLEHIFEPFYTKKVMGKSGTGLGLTVVWNTMLDHEGEIDVHSDNSGTTFSLYFPVTNKQLEESPALNDLEPVLGNGQTVLVVDDDPQQREIATQLLSLLNYKAVTSSSGEEAVAYLQDHTVDVLLLDMLMPPGINGLETYRQILAIHPGQKAVLASGFSESEDVKKALELGASYFVKKPYVIEQLAVVLFSTLL
jgi:PAS domain S-box-containing protein